ncbi:MAG TPA: Uma2 family endonuclease [Tepidiformaceae bacterium]|nr:Uma2 family endonuclease [Tepidiformaceae bacterium]
MSARQAARPVSLEEFLRLPETEPSTELVDGVMEQKPVGKIRHARAQSRILQFLMNHPATEGGVHFAQLGIRFPRSRPGNLRVPDVAYYAEESAVETETDYPALPPDLAAEVRSQGQPLRVLRERLAFLREQGTRCTLLIDPEEQFVEVHDGPRTFTAGPADEVRLDELGGFSFRAGQLFE